MPSPGTADAMALSDHWPLPDSALRERLEVAYGDPGRGYHDRRHLLEVLSRLDELAEHGTRFDPLVVRLAAWFHDAVYDGHAGAEDRSASWAQDELPAHGLTDDQVREVARLVRMTEHHLPAEDDLDGCALSDADLAILAAPVDRYDRYVEDVRREYAHVPEADFRRGRSAVLSSLAAKPSLFHTAHAREHWEASARANLARELRRLGADAAG
jgi:predicted metal-dependent HD superfamily phosphohydrolase